jgi:hypothetical protein
LVVLFVTFFAISSLRSMLEVLLYKPDFV